MLLRNPSVIRPMMAVLAVAMLVWSRWSCLGVKTSLRWLPTSCGNSYGPGRCLTRLTVDGLPTTMPVDQMQPDPYMDGEVPEEPGLRSGVKGQPITGGTYIFEAQRDNATFNHAKTRIAATSTSELPRTSYQLALFRIAGPGRGISRLYRVTCAAPLGHVRRRPDPVHAAWPRCVRYLREAWLRNPQCKRSSTVGKSWEPSSFARRPRPGYEPVRRRTARLYRRQEVARSTPVAQRNLLTWIV